MVFAVNTTERAIGITQISCIRACGYKYVLISTILNNMGLKMV
jgi:hypothetical protein